MSKKFTEYSQLNLSDVNKEVLKKWDACCQIQFHAVLKLGF